jgi:predicted ferric reductase
MARRIGIGVAIGILLLLVLDAFGTRVGFTSSMVPKLEGTVVWTTSRAAGVTAFLALTLDVVFGLFLSTGAADRFVPRGRSVDVHRWLSGMALGFTALHAFSLMGDRFINFDVLDLLVPFLAPHRPFAVGLGVLAAEGALVVYGSFWLRRRIGARAWRKLHYLSFAVFVAAIAHGLLAGTDAAMRGIRALYVVAIMLVTSLVIYRAFGQRHARARVPRRAEAT